MLAKYMEIKLKNKFKAYRDKVDIVMNFIKSGTMFHNFLKPTLISTFWFELTLRLCTVTAPAFFDFIFELIVFNFCVLFGVDFYIFNLFLNNYYFLNNLIY